MKNIGGTPAIIRYLLELGFLDGDCMTGKTLSENAKLFPSLSEGQQVIRPLTNPIKETGHIQILYGNLPPEGSVAKITGKEGLYFSGPTFVFEGEEAMLAAICEDPMSFKKLLLIKKHLIWCVGGEIIVCDIPTEDYNIELENQNGETVQLGSETDQRSVMVGLMLHANATQLIRMERYKDALEVLPMGEVKALCRNENDTQKALDDLTNPESNSAIQINGLKSGGYEVPFSNKDLLPMDFKFVWEAMEECHKLGLSKHIGVSNFSCKKVQQLLLTSKIPPAVNQLNSSFRIDLQLSSFKIGLQLQRRPEFFGFNPKNLPTISRYPTTEILQPLLPCDFKRIQTTRTWSIVMKSC
ncbi:unnamed protein product [Camellia sinensis]